MNASIGIDVGGTKCLGVLVVDGEVVSVERRATPPAARLADELADLVGSLAGGRTVSVGVGVPGLVTHDGVIRSSPNIPAAVETPIGAQLSERLGTPVVVDNDATCALVAEADRGAARDVSDAWLVTLGTGIGGALLAGGEPRRGWQGFAGEVGHIIVQRDGIVCGCGLEGCWERYASASALAAAAGGAEHIATRPDVVAAWAEWVAIGIAALVTTTDPEAVVIGGGVLDSVDVVMPAILERVPGYLYAPSNRRIPSIRSAELGVRAGALGAALLAERSVGRG